MGKRNYLPSAVAVALFALVASASLAGSEARFQPVEGHHGMVVTGQALATQSGLEVLKRGGNAVDAAVTIGFVMAVTLPSAGNIGGGGFMLIHSGEKGEVVALDYRERAPERAFREMYLDEEGDADPQLSRFSHLAAGVPGTVAGLAMALERYGTLSLSEALAPAIRYAEQGFAIGEGFARHIRESADRLKRFPASAKVFFKADGSLYQAGERFIQKDLARTLKKIAAEGPKGFYQGEVADLIVKQMEAHGGLITREDLQRYTPVLRTPVTGDYRGHKIYSMGPPSSGGTHILQILNILEGFEIGKLGHNSAETIHLMAEASRRAYADRSRYLGDPDFVQVPLRGLTSKAYAEELRKQIDRARASSSQAVKPGDPLRHESEETTHFSVVDGKGNAVSNTYTINFGFGSGIVVGGAGFLLNNEMDDFSAKPGSPNAYGLLGGDANAIAPNKRMLSSMSPVIVKQGDQLRLVTGSPGGARIITTTLQVIMNVIDHQMNIQEAVNAVRVHHQWLPDEIRVEQGLSPDSRRILVDMGHKVVEKRPMGAASSVLIDPQSGTLYGAADPREEGLAAGY